MGDPQVLEVLSGTLESRVKLDKEDCLVDLDPLDPLGIVNSVMGLLPRQTNRPIKKALKLITIPGQALIGPARTAQLPMLQGRLPRILPRAWHLNWWQGHAQYHDYNHYYLFCAQYYNHVNP